MQEIEQDDLPLSRTKKKQLAKEVEQLAARLADIPDSQLRQLQLTDAVAEEVELVRATRGRGSHKRQVKHLAGVLRKREDELERLLEQLQGLDQVARSEKRDFHLLEQLRDRLCDQAGFESAFAEMVELYPEIDRKAIARLSRSVHQYGDKRAFREVFKRLRDAQEA